MQAKRQTKIQVLKDDLDKLFFENIESLVDANSNGAKAAKYEKQFGM